MKGFARQNKRICHIKKGFAKSDEKKILKVDKKNT